MGTTPRPRRWTLVIGTPPPAPRRVALISGYLLAAAAGVASVVWISPSVNEAGVLLAHLWAAFLVTGGTLSAIGAIRGRWRGEYIGLPLLIAAFLAYCVSIGLAAYAASRPTTVALIMVLLSMAAFLSDRWREVGTIRRAAVEYAAVYVDEEGP